MALTFLYRDLDATDTDITSYVVLRYGTNPFGMSSNAEERSVGTWELEIEDDGVLDLHAQRTFYVLEDDTEDGDPVLWVGQTEDKHSERGDIKRTGPERVYRLTLVDLNTLLERRVILADDSPNRPEETDVERVQWLYGLGYIGTSDDFIIGTGPVDMDAVDYTGRMVSEVLEDCMEQSGKNCFMFRDPDTEDFTTFYGDSSADTDVLTSDIRISNVLSDVDNVTTWEPLIDADMWEATSRIYSRLFVNYDGGTTTQENATTVANFSHRDTVISWPDVKTLAKANARALRYLDDIGTEEYRITASIEVDSDAVGLMPQAGWRMQCRFSHYPPFTEFTWMRILSRATSLIARDRYRIQYVLSPGSPPPPAGDILVAFIAHVPTGAAPTDTSTNPWIHAEWSGGFGNPGQFPGPGHDVGMAIWYRAVVPGEDADVLRISGGGLDGTAAWVFQIAGADIASIVTDGGADTATATPYMVDSPSASAESVWLAGFMLQKVDYGEYTKMNASAGTVVVNASSGNLMSTCGVKDPAPPHTFIAYATGTGVLSIGAVQDPTCTFWTGATPNYNLFGRGFGGVLLELIDEFAITQQGFNNVGGSDCVVTLPSPP